MSADSHSVSTVDDCRLIRLPHHLGDFGSLTVADSPSLPFTLRRVYYIYDLPAGAERGGHSHYREHRLLIAASGCFDVTVDDGIDRRTFTLRSPFYGLYIPPGLWRTLSDFSSGAIALALCSNLYSADDYVRDYDLFLSLKSARYQS